ncbi:MAG: glutamate racemase [Clostridia bacterium]|nr:glutamate racemase [Clostridia bacterium]
MADSRPIGVFDSGLGGLTVTKEIIKLLPNEDIIYFGDTGRVPYGTKGPETIKKYAADDEKFLLSKNVKLIVAACGTVSSVASEVSSKLPVPFIEVISHSVKSAVSATRNKKIGVLATAATIKSGKHKKLILDMMPDALVTEVAGTLLVPIVEEGFYGSGNPVLENAVKIYTKPFKDNNIDTLILGCTHFPLVADAIKKEMGEDVVLINMGIETAKAVKDTLKSSDMLNLNGGNHKFFVSDKGTTFEKTAFALLGEKVNENNIETVDIKNI